MDPSHFCARIGGAFGVTAPPLLSIANGGGTAMAVVRQRSRFGHPGWVGPFAREDSFVVMLHLREVISQSLRLDDELLHVEGCPAGAVNVLDLRREVSISTPTPFDCVYFYVPLEGLNVPAGAGDSREMTAPSWQQGQREMTDLPCQQSRREPTDLPCQQNRREPAALSWQQGQREPTTWRLGTQLLRALNAPQSFGAGQLESMAGRLNAHFTQTFGGLRVPSESSRGGLAPWQVRRALKVIKDSLQAPLGFAEVAAACSLSVSHFHRAFRQSIGESPGRWLQQYRMKVAKELLLSSQQNLAEIGARCGFADQSHFTRVFSRWAGMSPGAWRREQQEAVVAQLEGRLNMSPGASRREQQQQQALATQLEGGLKETGAKETGAEVSSMMPGVGARSLRIQPGAPSVTGSG
jgi:AraC family transcriptional regulator